MRPVLEIKAQRLFVSQPSGPCESWIRDAQTDGLTALTRAALCLSAQDAIQLPDETYMVHQLVGE